MSGRRVVVGVGNPYRGDDGAGLAVAERLRGRLPDGVDDERGVRAVPCVEEPRRLVRALGQLDPVRQPAAEPLGDREPGAVVAAVRVADADDHATAAHRRSTSSVRKCVAHEMHGS